MGVIQIDMQIPKNCLDCPACNEYLMCAIPINGRKWGENDVRDFSQSRPEWCPLKEQEPVEPLAIRKDIVDEVYDWIAECPACGMTWAMWHPDRMRFCPGCGKAVKWG